MLDAETIGRRKSAIGDESKRHFHRDDNEEDDGDKEDNDDGKDARRTTDQQTGWAQF